MEKQDWQNKKTIKNLMDQIKEQETNFEVAKLKDEKLKTDIEKKKLQTLIFEYESQVSIMKREIEQLN